MKVLVTGAQGLLAQAVAAHFSRNNEVWALDHQHLDITNIKQIESVLKAFLPQLVINCAAMARVDECEVRHTQAEAVNALAPGLLATAAEAVGADILHISTDYVFDGKKRELYTTEDMPQPLSVYGETKLAGEKAVQTATDRYYIVRVARLFGWGGNNFGSRIYQFLQQAEERKAKLKVFEYPLSQATYLPDLALRLQEIAISRSYGLYQVTSSGAVVGWPQFVHCAAEIMGLTDDLIEIVSYQALSLPALRPYYSGLRCLKSEALGFSSLPDWREGLVALYQHWQKNS